MDHFLAEKYHVFFNRFTVFIFLQYIFATTTHIPRGRIYKIILVHHKGCRKKTHVFICGEVGGYKVSMEAWEAQNGPDGEETNDQLHHSEQQKSQGQITQKSK